MQGDEDHLEDPRRAVDQDLGLERQYRYRDIDTVALTISVPSL